MALRGRNLQTYCKNKQGVLLGDQFVYEVLVFVYFQNTMSLVTRKLFSCDKEINNVVPFYKINKFVEIQCELYMAPESWLIKNNYTKIERNGQKNKVTKPRSRKTVSSPDGSRDEELQIV